MIKRLLVIILLATVLFSAVYYYLRFGTPFWYFFQRVRPEQDADKDVLGEEYSVFTEEVKPVYDKPVKLLIESVGISVDVIEVGLENDGALEAPKDWFVSGWYTQGALVGAPGNLIIDGHYDTNRGTPAAFWQLKNVKTGDIVSVHDSLGRVFRYEVKEVFYIDINDPNRLQIFKSNEKTSSITLITCGGIWLPGNYTYSQRLIVKGELIQ